MEILPTLHNGLEYIIQTIKFIQQINDKIKVSDDKNGQIQELNRKFVDDLSNILDNYLVQLREKT